ncbi:hypothetical protein GCM10027047_37950 [Rhodococcus aerolatus]
MRVSVVAGPDPGHAFPATALCLRLRAAGHEPVLFTGSRWLPRLAEEGLDARELPGLALRPTDDEHDEGSRLHDRAAYMSTPLLAPLRASRPDVVVSDVLTAAGSFAAERLGLPWVELNPHPLYLPSRGLPPMLSGLAPGRGPLGRLRDRGLRRLAEPSVRLGRSQRRAARLTIDLPADDPGPVARLVATLPALELPRPDWPAEAHVVGPLLWDPTRAVLAPPPGDAPLVLLSPSTASSGRIGLLQAALTGLTGVRLAATVLPGGADTGPLPPWAVVGPGRQDLLLAEAAVVVCGAGHGMLAKCLAAGVPVVTVPGGGDQWELANRAKRQGSGVLVRPLTPERLAAGVRRVLDDPGYRAAASRAAASAAQVRADPVVVCERAAA